MANRRKYSGLQKSVKFVCREKYKVEEIEERERKTRKSGDDV